MGPLHRTVLLCLVGVPAACAGHRVAHVAPDESRPHITWEIRTGGDLGSDEFVCGSTQPSRACMLTASTADRRAMITVRLHLHAARHDTSYLGVMRVPFMEGLAGLKDREVSATVPVGSQPVGSTLSGWVTSKPGKYVFTVSLEATQVGSTTSARIRENVPVLVK